MEPFTILHQNRFDLTPAMREALAAPIFKKPQRILYTDGACLGNPGPGGWAAVLINLHEGKGLEIVGGELQTTNNRMELMGVIAGLRCMAPGQSVLVVADSMYVLDGITKWIRGWKAKGWVTSKKEPVKNRELWERLDALRGNFQLSWKHVLGHKEHLFNERCDLLARQAIEYLNSS